MNANPITQARQIHFIGIGGIGISALARLALEAGKIVTGSDQSGSLITAELERLGAKIFVGHRAEQVTPKTDLVIYTIAVSDHNPELERARELGLTIISYPQALGLVSADKYTIAVSGTHGKTTTTAMIAQILLAAGLDPTVIVGSLLTDLSTSRRTNFIQGKSDYLVVEACEYRRSFLNLSPKILVITNIDNDHLDYFKDWADIESAFAELAGKLPPDGALICDQKNEHLSLALAASQARVIDYALVSSAQFNLLVPGEHNVWNAQAALAVATVLKISPTIALGALNKFSGTWRRFEYKGKSSRGAAIYDDYGHHPTEIRATLKVARERCRGKLWVIFQPHLYSRTKLLFNDFADSFHDADEVIVTDIYAAREPIDPTVSAEILATAINRQGPTARYLGDFKLIREELNRVAGPEDLILTLGAGDIFLMEQE